MTPVPHVKRTAAPPDSGDSLDAGLPQRTANPFRMSRSDPALPGLAALLDTAYLQQRLTCQLQIPDLCRVNTDSLRYKPGTSCLASFLVEIPGQNSLLPVHAKTYRPDHWPIVRAKVLAGNGRGIPIACWIDDDHYIQVYQFPNDTALPAIARFFQAPERLLSRLRIPAGGTSNATGQTTVLAYKPNRRLTIRVHGDYLLKFHEPDRFSQVLSTTRALAGLNPITPSYVGRSRRYGAIAYRWIDGQPLELEKMDDTRFDSTVQQIVHWTDRLQAQTVIDSIRPQLRRNELETLIARSQSVLEYVGSICPELAGLASEFSNRLGAVSDVPRLAPCLNHGDFHFRQLIDGPHGMRCCDFDNAALGDPTADLANGIAHLALDSIQGLLGSAKAEQAEYQILAMLSERVSAARPSFYLHLACGLARLGSAPFRRLQPDWIEQTERILQLGLHKLSQFHSSRWSGQGESLSQPSSPVTALADDPALEFLTPALDLKIAHRVIKANVTSLTPWLARSNIVSAKIIRHKPGRRCLVRYQLGAHADGSPGPSILAKAHWRRADRRAFATQDQLHRNHGFGETAADGIQVPRALGILPEWKMWFQSFVPGKTAQKLMEQRRLAEVAPRIGQALAKLHSCSFRPERTHSMADELTILGDRLTQTQKLQPRYADRLATVRWACERLADRVNPSPTAPIHRDFYQDQILFTESKTILVDLDLVSWGHPGLDLANFLAHLIEFSIRQHGNPDTYATEAAMIVDSYCQIRRLSPTDLAALQTISLARHLAICQVHSDRRGSFLPLLLEVEAQCRTALTR